MIRIESKRVSSTVCKGFSILLCIVGVGSCGPASDLRVLEIYSARLLSKQNRIERDKSSSTTGLVATMDSDDLDFIADNEIYLHLVIFDCSDEGLRYPAIPAFQGTSLHDFTALKRAMQESREGRPALEAELPVNFLSRLSSVCVKAEGGSYGGIEVTSNAMTLSESSVSH